MNVLSLFSGIGGLDLGLERAGMTVVGQVEIDPWCRSILAKHWPEVPRHDDVRTAAEWWSDRDAPDLVAGGFPCQPVSLAGKGLAQADSRWLWPAMADVVRALRPRYVLVENVPGLLGRGMGDVLGDLASLGFDAEWDSVPAAFVGAPHIRNRVWIVAYPQRKPVRTATGGVLAAPGAREGEGPQRERVWPDAGDGSAHMADTDSGRRKSFRVAEPAGQPSARRGEPDRCGEDRQLNDAAHVAHAERHGLQGPEHAITRQGTAAIGRRPADPDSAHMADTSRIGRGQGPRIFRGLGPAGRRWRITEPCLGERADGVSAGLDGAGLDAENTQTRSGETLPRMRPADDAAPVQRQAGRPRSVYPPGLLQPAVHGSGLCQRHVAAELEAETDYPVPWELLRVVWGYGESARPSHRRESGQRLAAEHPDLVRFLSRHAPPPCPACWADGSWEDGLPRVASGVPRRVDRLRGLGNAVVPQVAEHIGRLIMAAVTS